MLAMVLHPRVQAKAQQEIDAVVGSERLPNFADRASLPYLEAVLREILRWRPVTPMGTHLHRPAVLEPQQESL
jgi:cytochrome P450